MFGTLDRDLFSAVQDLAAATGWAHGLVVDYARYGVALFGPLLLVAWWRARSEPGPTRAVAMVLWAGLAAVLALAVNHGLVHLVDRQRPFVALPDVHPLLDHEPSPGFPSNHAMAVGAMAAGVWRFAYRLGLVAAALAVLMCFARVYCGVHWPADVTAGALLGALIAWFGWPLARLTLEPLCTLTARTRLHPLIRTPTPPRPTSTRQNHPS